MLFMIYCFQIRKIKKCTLFFCGIIYQIISKTQSYNAATAKMMSLSESTTPAGAAADTTLSEATPSGTISTPESKPISKANSPLLRKIKTHYKQPSCRELLSAGRLFYRLKLLFYQNHSIFIKKVFTKTPRCAILRDIYCIYVF